MISAFFFALVTSFWGSIPPGPSNLAVLHTVLNKNTRAGFWMSLGACIPELPYTFGAILAVQYVSAFQNFSTLFELATAIVLLAIGIYSTFFQSQKKIDLEKSTEIERFKVHPFWKGAIIGSLNPMIFAFWLVTAEVATNTGWLDTNLMSQKISFMLGSAIGALMLLILVTIFTHNIKQKLTTSITSLLNKTIGVTFILLGLVQAFKFYMHHF
jgi:threonine/homoserine/homoserine lactone efflux protein